MYLMYLIIEWYPTANSNNSLNLFAIYVTLKAFRPELHVFNSKMFYFISENELYSITPQYNFPTCLCWVK